jgi:hypothetical protein
MGSFLPSSQRLPHEVHPVHDFQRRLKKERLRADRAHSMFSLVVIEPPAGPRQRSLAALARRVLRRVRFSDDVGLLGDGRLGVFLPDTPATSAWRIAEDIVAMYADQPARPKCQVYVHPLGPSWDAANAAPPRNEDSLHASFRPSLVS